MHKYIHTYKHTRILMHIPIHNVYFTYIHTYIGNIYVNTKGAGTLLYVGGSNQ